MSVIDLLVTIVVVTILVTIVLAIVTYVAYKLRHAREPAGPAKAADGLRYFVRQDPPEGRTESSTVRVASPTGSDAT